MPQPINPTLIRSLAPRTRPVARRIGLSAEDASALVKSEAVAAVAAVVPRNWRRDNFFPGLFSTLLMAISFYEVRGRGTRYEVRGTRYEVRRTRYKVDKRNSGSYLVLRTSYLVPRTSYFY